jgi:hypothetical protein
MDESSIVDTLDDCLVSEIEMGKDWETFENPFPGTREWSQPLMEQRLVVGDQQHTECAVTATQEPIHD